MSLPNLPEIEKTREGIEEIRSSARALSKHTGQEELAVSIRQYADQYDGLLDDMQQVGIDILLRLKAINEQQEEK